MPKMLIGKSYCPAGKQMRLSDLFVSRAFWRGGMAPAGFSGLLSLGLCERAMRAPHRWDQYFSGTHADEWGWGSGLHKAEDIVQTRGLALECAVPL